MSSADTEEQEQQDAAVENDAAAEANAVRQEILDQLKAALGDAVVGEHIQGGDLWVRVNATDWRRAAEACKNAGFVYFDFLSGLDWMPSAPNPEDAETLSVEPEADADEAPDPEEAAEAEDECIRDAEGDRPAQREAMRPLFGARRPRDQQRQREGEPLHGSS